MLEASVNSRARRAPMTSSISRIGHNLGPMLGAVTTGLGPLGERCLCRCNGSDTLNGGDGFDRMNGGGGYDICWETERRRCEQFYLPQVPTAPYSPTPPNTRTNSDVLRTTKRATLKARFRPSDSLPREDSAAARGLASARWADCSEGLDHRRQIGGSRQSRPPINRRPPRHE